MLFQCFFSDGEAYLIFSSRHLVSNILIQLDYFNLSETTGTISYNILHVALQHEFRCYLLQFYMSLCISVQVWYYLGKNKLSMFSSNWATKIMNGIWSSRSIYCLKFNDVVFTLAALLLTFNIPDWAKDELNEIYAERILCRCISSTAYHPIFRLKLDFNKDFIFGNTLEIVICLHFFFLFHCF